MTKIINSEEQQKIDNYFVLMEVHKTCENGPYFGGELWKHIKKCFKGNIPEPKIERR